MSTQCSLANTKPISVNVRVKLTNGKPDYHVKWKKTSFWPWGWKDGPIDQPAGTGPYELTFELDDDTGLDLRFLEPADEAIWVMPDSCPPGKCNNGGQITPVKVDDDGTELVITNANSGAPVNLHYALNFSGALSANGPPYSHDPIIKNGGGG